MSLIRCPECSREISDAAFVCPACGRPMREGGSRTGAAAMALSSDVPPFVGFEYRSKRTILGLPLVHILYGSAWLTGFRPARGIIAIGNIAIGVVAFGGIALGGVALGGLSLGLLCFGGLALGLGVGLGGIATGYVALGGIAIGIHTVGGLEIGLHALRSNPRILQIVDSQSMFR